MKMKKLLCLLLALLMVFSLAACGGDAGNTGDDEEDDDDQRPNREPSATTEPAEPSLEDLGPWVVTKEVLYSDDWKEYTYDENGNVISMAAYDGDDFDKYRDYNATTTQTASGGKITVVESKHVRDSEFEKDYEMEYDADGNLIRYSSFMWDEVSSEYLLTYDDAGNLLNYVYNYEGMLGDQVVRKVEYTYENGLLMAIRQTTQLEEEAPVVEFEYAYTYDEDGWLKSVWCQHGEYEENFWFEKEVTSYGMTRLRLAEDCDHYVPNKNVLIYEEEYDEEGNPCKITVIFNSWGFQQYYALAYPTFGVPYSGNWQACLGEITYTRLDVHLAEQAGE